MTITLVRHGEVEEAFLHCYNGHNDIGLSPNGKAQAQTLAHRLEGNTFDAVYCSDLKRCRETLSPIIQNSAVDIQSLYYTPQLREKSWGRHEGMSFNTIVEKEGLVYENFLQWINALDGEPVETYIERINAFFTRELPRTPYENVLVVTHAGVIRSLMHLLQKVPLEEAFGLYFPYGAYTTLNSTDSTFGELQCV